MKHKNGSQQKHVNYKLRNQTKSKTDNGNYVSYQRRQVSIVNSNMKMQIMN